MLCQLGCVFDLSLALGEVEQNLVGLEIWFYLDDLSLILRWRWLILKEVVGFGQLFWFVCNFSASLGCSFSLGKNGGTSTPLALKDCRQEWQFMERNFKISFCIIPSSFSTRYCAQRKDHHEIQNTISVQLCMIIQISLQTHAAHLLLRRLYAYLQVIEKLCK